METALDYENFLKDLDTILNETRLHAMQAMSNYNSTEYKIPSAKKRKTNPEQPLLLTGGTLKPHQVTGYEWLKKQFHFKLNAMLADEMGLGKTVQVVSIIAYLIEHQHKGPFLICAPLSVLSTWIGEFKKFAPRIPTVICHGKKTKVQWRKFVSECNSFEKRVAWKLKTYGVILCSHETGLTAKNYFKNIQWCYIVVDEGHRLKNLESKLYDALRTYKECPTLILTGTPLQNNLTELLSLLNFILPLKKVDMKRLQKDVIRINQLLSCQNIEEVLTVEKESAIVQKIQQLLTPFILRRTKKDVDLNLPPRKKVFLFLPLTTIQQEYYDRVIEISQKKNNETTIEFPKLGKRYRPKENDPNFSYCEVGSDDSDYDSENNIYDDNTDCLSPNISCDSSKTLYNKSNSVLTEKNLEYVSTKLSVTENNLQDEKFLNNSNRASFDVSNMCPGISDNLISKRVAVPSNAVLMYRKICCHPFLLVNNSALINASLNHVINASSKMKFLDASLEELKKQHHKVIIFSQFKGMLDVLEKYCILRKFRYCRLDGDTPRAARDIEIQSFQTDSSLFIFLATTRAGGVGLNLTAADTVIIYDSDYNPQMDIQAEARCHRIGQKKPVLVIYLASKGTVDEIILKYASNKQNLEKIILSPGRFCSDNTLMKTQQPIESEDIEVLNQTDTHIQCNENEIPQVLKQVLDRSQV